MIRRFRPVMGSFQLRGHIVKTQYSGLSHESCAPDHSTALNVYTQSVGNYSETFTNKPSSSIFESVQRSLSPSFIREPFVTSSSVMVSLPFSSQVMTE